MCEQILEPLGMRSSGFALTDATRPHLATGYDPNPYSDEPAPSAHPDIRGKAAAGQLYATVNDLARGIALQFREEAPAREGAQVLTGRSLREMFRPAFMEPRWASGFCLSWMATRRGDNVYPGHGGGIHGFTTQLAVEMLESVLKAEAAAPKPLPAPSFTSMPPAWQPFLSRYTGPLGLHIQIEHRTSGLVIAAPTQPPTYLDPADEPHIFLAKDQRFAGERLTFRLAADGGVTGFDVSGFAFRKLVEAPG